jgi:hypothetical protein
MGAATLPWRSKREGKPPALVPVEVSRPLMIAFERGCDSLLKSGAG